MSFPLPMIPETPDAIEALIEALVGRYRRVGFVDQSTILLAISAVGQFLAILDSRLEELEKLQATHDERFAPLKETS